MILFNEYKLSELIKFKIQFVWWGRVPTVKFYRWPEAGAIDTEHFMYPLYYGFYFGLFEFRLFNTRWSDFMIRSRAGGIIA